MKIGFGKYTKLLAVLFVVLLAAFLVGRFFQLADGIPSLRDLPLLAYFSAYRMLFAYIASLIFSVVYGYYAATNKKAEQVLIPILDILQSVPILGFFPVAIFFFISLFPGGAGVEVAAIFLIFTSMNWNMTFGVYESIKTIPEDLGHAAKAFGVRRFLAFRNLVFPACIPKLTYNSIASWANGWYFLIASEIISLGGANYKLPGLGSFLFETAARGAVVETLAGLAMLLAIIISMDFFLWRPLSAWSEKFKYDVAVSGRRPDNNVYSFFHKSTRFQGGKRILNRTIEYTFDELEKAANYFDHAYLNNSYFKSLVKGIAIGFYRLLLLLGGYTAYYFASVIFGIFASPLPPEAGQIPLAILYSFLRVAAAYFIALLWTVPVAIYIAKHERIQKYLMPMLEIAGAVPATALFPILAIIVIGATGSVDLAAILLIVTAMQWYLFFNAIIGARSIPTELDQAVTSLGVKGRLYYTKVMLPAMLPGLVTGSITAIGGAWNAVFIAEYITYAGQTYTPFGIGSIMSKVAYDSGDVRLMVLSVIALSAFIFAFNNLFWRKIYSHVIKKYRMEL